MTPARRRGTGRWIAFGVAVLFVAISSLVVWRRGEGIARGRRMRAMQDTLRQLAVEQADLARDIRQARQRARLLEAARALGLREPADSQVRALPPRAPGRDAPDSDRLLDAAAR
jgi:hypothetical protein